MRRGFTLTEVLMAMAIFLLGVVFVAAIFPAAALLQKETIATVTADQVGKNVEGIVSAVKYNQSDLIANLPPTFDADKSVYSFPSRVATTIGSDGENYNQLIIGRWSHRDRSHNPDTAQLYGARMAPAYWVPLVMDADPTEGRYEWRVFVFVLRRLGSHHPRSGPEADYANYWDGWNQPKNSNLDLFTVPGVRRVNVTVDSSATPPNRFAFDNAILSVGDMFLDQHGTTHTVIDADDTGATVNGFIVGNPTYIWAAERTKANDPNPCIRIHLIEEAIDVSR